MRSSDILRNEHKLIERMMQAVEKGINSVDNGKPLPGDFLDKAIDFFWEFAVQFHFEKEEELLFDEMERAGVYSEQLPIEAFRYEHQVQREYLERVSREWNQVHEACPAQSDCKEKETRFIRDLEKFLFLLRRHSKLEDRVLYPMGDRLIDEKNDQKLLEYYLNMEKRFSDYQEKYEKLVEQFEYEFSETRTQIV